MCVFLCVLPEMVARAIISTICGKVNFVPYAMTPSGTLIKTISLADHRPAHDIENAKCGCLALIYKDEKR